LRTKAVDLASGLKVLKLQSFGASKHEATSKASATKAAGHFLLSKATKER
jgi:hypothetical protein